jgi:hypothetical protein
MRSPAVSLRFRSTSALRASLMSVMFAPKRHGARLKRRSLKYRFVTDRRTKREINLPYIGRYIVTLFCPRFLKYAISSSRSMSMRLMP